MDQDDGPWAFTLHTSKSSSSEPKKVSSESSWNLLWNRLKTELWPILALFFSSTIIPKRSEDYAQKSQILAVFLTK